MATVSMSPPALGAHKDEPQRQSLKYGLLIAGLVICVALFIFPPPPGLSVTGWHVLGLMIPIVMIWATEAMPVGVASVLFLALVTAFHLVKSAVAFQGFLNQLPWLLAGAFALGTAMETTGLSKRMTYFLLSHVRGFWGLSGAAYAANLFMMAIPSSSARSGIMAPILRSILSTIGNPKGSNLSRVLTYNFCTAANSFVGTLFLTGGASNAVFLAIYQQMIGKTISWMGWLELMFLPTMLFCAVALALGYLFSPPERELVEKLRDSSAAKEAYAALPPMSANEWKVLAGFVLAIVLWVFGTQLGLDPGFAALIVMGLLFLPKVGVLEANALKALNWDIVLLVGAIMGVAGILDQSGVIAALSKVLVAPVLGPLSSFGLIGIAVGCVIVGIVAHFLLPGPTNLTLALPLLFKWGMAVIPGPATFAFLGMLSELNDKNVLFPYWLPPYYVYLSQDVTDIPRFNVLLARVFPFTTLATIVGAYLVYWVALLTGIGVR